MLLRLCCSKDTEKAAEQVGAGSTIAKAVQGGCCFYVP